MNFVNISQKNSKIHELVAEINREICQLVAGNNLRISPIVLGKNRDSVGMSRKNNCLIRQSVVEKNPEIFQSNTEKES